MKVKCTSKDASYFTFDQVYDVSHVDSDGDYWTTDDEGDSMFLFPDECEVVEE